MPLRILFLADTHLGFDLPLRPRVRRRRRGEDFLANFRRALQPALAGEVDLVVHGGDVFHTPRPHPSLVYQAFEPLQRIADGGVPVFVVPGNHERGRIPHERFTLHPLIHIFDHPRSFQVERRGLRIRLLGFPYIRRIRDRFSGVMGGMQRDARGPAPDLSLLCVHHCFEGSRVQGHTFLNAPDVIRMADVPPSLAAVLTGHVHRHQVLHRDPAGRRLPTPILYPGSVERTSFAERDEAKGYMTLALEGNGEGGKMVGWRFHELPARPMLVREVKAGPATEPRSLARTLDEIIGKAPADAVLRLRVRGSIPPEARGLLSASSLRERAPATMNVTVAEPRGRRAQRRETTGSRRVEPARPPPSQHPSSSGRTGTR